MRYKTDKLPGWVNYERLQKKAQEIRRRDPALTEEQSIAKAAEQNPAIVERYHREAREDIGG